ncbi:tRNA (adenosine(37)-N6)-dimethylallyltransferase MiaA [Gryllotalpicola protaetiae]|uniref:tRNA dimethylallyltransferase n=1 Tax=Gryllotalpicola protaetiae TaxID=2419771 RepID=A0A387BML2_9MICO|nr:tRNA (adenosine(37)-N6)-dimethylallyltransferase MiaA [Gryllotalpicola protaetiae]AYG05445.1 tRNA (adenosine(37)-N6)-dimethylallyltransferase MiaA [Gryllotalpicola protaetiae]
MTGAPLLAVVGATGTGKSELAIGVAESLAARGEPAEIVNADAMQLYRGMDIGTAKVSETQRRGIPHHLLDALDVTDEASVAAYQRDARVTIEAIQRRGAIPILVGGSGLYVSSVVYDFRFPARDRELRARLERELEQQGPGRLYARLKAVDPATAERVDPANGRRVVRALEIHELAELGHGAALPESPRLWHPSVVIGLSTPRELLVTRLDARVEAMWAEGLVAEADGLRSVGLEQGVTASRAIGYAQALAQLRGELSEPEAIAQTQAMTRRYARRQVSWFKRYEHVAWFDTEAADASQRAHAAVDRLDEWRSRSTSARVTAPGTTSSSSPTPTAPLS